MTTVHDPSAPAAPGPVPAAASAPIEWGDVRSKTITWHDPAITAGAVPSRSGLAFLEAIRDGELPPPPIANLMGLELTEVAPGLVVFECEPDESAYNPIGTVHGGLMCTLADSVTACAIHSTLEAGLGYTSIDLNVSYLRPVTAASGRLRATGQVTKSGRRVGFASAEIVDGAGRLVASATTSCLIFEVAAS
jgi:uncharacterized protein (TIGR00369 family)